jgi:hypothetical protein
MEHDDGPEELWDDAEEFERDELARFLAAYPDGWTCQDCSCEYLPGECHPVMPAEDLDGWVAGDGTVCPLGHGCKEDEAEDLPF